MSKDLGELGLRKLSDMNRACLLKLAWGFKNGNNELWCKVLKGKYERRQLGENPCISKSTDSSLWKALMDVWLVTIFNEYWMIGNGGNIDAWNSCWLDAGFKISYMKFNIPPHIVSCKVADLVEENGKWKWSLLDDWLPIDIEDKIRAITISLYKEYNVETLKSEKKPQ
jgi:hypothetical protein